MVYNLVGIRFALDSHQDRLAKCDLALAIYIWLCLSLCPFGCPQLTSNNSKQSVKKKTVTNFGTWPGCFNGRFERSRNALSYMEVPLRQNESPFSHYLPINGKNRDKKTCFAFYFAAFFIHGKGNFFPILPTFRRFNIPSSRGSTIHLYPLANYNLSMELPECFSTKHIWRNMAKGIFCDLHYFCFIVFIYYLIYEKLYFLSSLEV